MNRLIADRRAVALEESLALRVHAGYQPPRDWRTRAACTSPGPEQPHLTCPGCPVRLACLATIMRDETTCAKFRLSNRRPHKMEAERN